MWPHEATFLRMKTVGIRALKNQLSEYVRSVQSGERVTVTSRGAPVMDLVPRASHGLDPDDELLRLARAGKVRLGESNDPEVYGRVRPWKKLAADEVTALLDWTRGDR